MEIFFDLMFAAWNRTNSLSDSHSLRSTIWLDLAVTKFVELLSYLFFLSCVAFVNFSAEYFYFVWHV